MQDYGQYLNGIIENAGHLLPGKKGNRYIDLRDCLPSCQEKLYIHSF